MYPDAQLQSLEDEIGVQFRILDQRKREAYLARRRNGQTGPCLGHGCGASSQRIYHMIGKKIEAWEMSKHVEDNDPLPGNVFLSKDRKHDPMRDYYGLPGE